MVRQNQLIQSKLAALHTQLYDLVHFGLFILMPSNRKPDHHVSIEIVLVQHMMLL